MIPLKKPRKKPSKGRNFRVNEYVTINNFKLGVKKTYIMVHGQEVMFKNFTGKIQGNKVKGLYNTKTKGVYNITRV